MKLFRARAFACRRPVVVVRRRGAVGCLLLCPAGCCAVAAAARPVLRVPDALPACVTVTVSWRRPSVRGQDTPSATAYRPDRPIERNLIRSSRLYLSTQHARLPSPRRCLRRRHVHREHPRRGPRAWTPPRNVLTRPPARRAARSPSYAGHLSVVYVFVSASSTMWCMGRLCAEQQQQPRPQDDTTKMMMEEAERASERCCNVSDISRLTSRRYIRHTGTCRSRDLTSPHTGR